MSLYPPPEVIEMEVFTRLPDTYRKRDVRGRWADANAGGAALHSFLEGPSFDRAGDLIVTDIPWGRVFRVAPDGGWSLVVEYDGWPNGLKIDREGRAWITDYRHGILRLDLGSGAIEPVLTDVRSEGLKGVNDLYIDRQGNVWFTDQGQTGLHDPTGRVYRLEPASGRLTRVVDTVPSPNGIVMNRAETHLYVAVTRANQVWRMPIFEDGGTSKVAAFVTLSGGLGGPDGLAMDEDDNLLIAHAGNGCVWVMSRLGHPLYRLVVPDGAGMTVTNLAFGGADRRDLYVTESASGTILKARLPTAGRAMASHA
jgi:gluconolactonase